jgi:hypothetical protein
MSALAVFKEVRLAGTVYLVSRHEFSTRVEYTAWEPTTFTKVTSFMTKMGHDEIYIDQATKKKWGAINSRNPRNPEDDQLVLKLFDVKLLGKGFLPEGIITLTRGKIVMKKTTMDGKPMVDEVKPPTPKPAKAKKRQEDDFSTMLGAMDMNKLKYVAKLNNVTFKDSDTPGLLKMRVLNALRHIAKKGGTPIFA